MWVMTMATERSSNFSRKTNGSSILGDGSSTWYRDLSVTVGPETTITEYKEKR